MVSDTQHWNNIFANKTDQDLGWYEADLSQTMKYIEQVPLTPESVIFLPGAGTSFLVDKLISAGSHLIANDISNKALTKLAQRVENERLTCLCQSISDQFSSPLSVDLWIDRAVLHFLLSEQEISGYFNNLLKAVKVGGYVLLAEFSHTGAKKCAGLAVHQYSIAEMQERLGEDFELIASEEHTFINPFQQEKPYVYGFFKRIY